MTAANCEAYGTDPQAPRGCFFPGNPCQVLGGATCTVRMRAERVRVYQQMQRLAAAGDEVWASLLEEIDGPDDLLGGRSEPSGPVS